MAVIFDSIDQIRIKNRKMFLFRSYDLSQLNCKCQLHSVRAIDISIELSEVMDTQVQCAVVTLVISNCLKKLSCPFGVLCIAAGKPVTRYGFRRVRIR